MIWWIKLAALLWQRAEGIRPHSFFALSLFLFAWPGVSLTGFTERSPVPPPGTGSRFLGSWLTMIAGVLVLLAVSFTGRGESTALNYVALFSLLLIVHLGLMEVLADGLRLLGFAPTSLFDRPFLASSLRDFWSVRWNRAFVDMNKIFFLQPLRNRVPAGALVFSIFLVSGLLHEMGISYADNVSWGGPLLYFVVQGFAMAAEKRRRLPRVLVWLVLLLPAPLLFTPAFTNLFLGGLARLIVDFAQRFSREEMLRLGLLGGAFLHLLVICASVQVPGKLGWHEEFRKLRPLNRKVFWTYGAYIFSIILFLALTSFVLSQAESLLSAPARLWLLFIALFWWARVFTDTFYFSHADWPVGPLFTIGHVCLTTLFLTMALLYTTILFALVRA